MTSPASHVSIMTSPVSHVSRLITKECIILLFKPALYSSTLVIKDFESSIKLFYAEILTITLLASLLLKASQPERHAHY